MAIRRILIIWSIFSVLLAAGCSKHLGSGSGQASKRVTVRYENWEVYPAQLKLHQQVVDAFNQSQNEVHVKLEPTQGGPNKIKVEIAGGTAPDVFFWCDTILPPLVKKSSVIDLRPFIEREGVDLGQYFPALLDGLRYNGGIYGLPIYYGTNALVYNKAIFDAAHLPYPDGNWTWDDFRATARKLTVRKEGKLVQYGALLPGSMDVVESLGGKLFDPEGKRCLVDSREMREGLRYILTLQNVDKSVPSLAQLGGEADKLKNGLQMFMTGRIGMFIAPSFMLSSLQDVKAFSWDVAPMPTAAGRKRVSAFSTGTLHISSQSKVKEAAFKFLKFACGPEGTAIMGKGRNCIPPILEVAKKTFCTPPPEHISVYIDSIYYARPILKVTWADEFSSTVFSPETELFLLGKQDIESTVHNLSVKGQKFAGRE